MKRDDVIQVDALKTELAGAIREFDRRLTGVVGELVYSIDTVIDRYNDMETKQAELATRLDTVTTRLLALERLRGDGH